ncbi:MAG: LuxR C-terminal-related transcriptional regulator [Pseudomonadota bacterium]
MTETKTIGWAELEALQALARGGSLMLMRGPLQDLTSALDLGGYKFCIATPEPDGYRIAAVIAGGDLDAAPDGFLDAKIGPQDPILWESYRTRTPVSWTPYFTDSHLMEVSGVSKLAERGVTSGASIPILTRHQACRASLCVSGGRREAPEALDLRLPAFWPLLRLAGLALFEAGMAEAGERQQSALTPSEVAVLAALADGLRIREVATKLGKSERTIRNQLESARLRVGAATTIEAVVLWQRASSKLM